jgi:beta-lactam-binding protein with PASTA domain
MSNLVGESLNEAAADAIVRRLRLRLDPRDDPMANGPPGMIVRQSVAANAPIEPGTVVTVWVTTGVVVPTLVGLTAEAAHQQLAAKGLQAKRSELVRDRDPGVVVEQSPEAGIVVPREAVVGFSVAVLEAVRVPDVSGRSRGDAVRLLTASRLTGSFTSDEDSTLTPGLASGQDPPPGTEVSAGATVRVRVASGVRVPSVIGSTSGEARARLTSTGLNAESREIRTESSRSNIVFEQTPAAGQLVARGTAVVVSVALPPLVTVPDVRGRQRGEAAGQLSAARLRSDVADDPAAALAPGLVSAQAPAPGSQVDAGTIVRLQIAVGVVVPSVIGSSANDAQARIASVGLRGNVREVRTGAARAGTVFQQLPVADERVARGSVVELSLARAPLVSVPDLAQRTRAEAESLTAAAQLVIAFEGDAASTMPPDRISRQDPAAGASVEAGATVHAVVATGVLVPAVTTMPVRSARATLVSAGLRVDERGEVNDRVAELTVLRQSPESNARVAIGSLIRLVVAVRRTVTVPDFVGRRRGEVEQLLAPTGPVASFEEATTSDAGAVAGSVVQQVPPAGTVVGTGTAVRIVLVRAEQGAVPPAPPAPPPTPAPGPTPAAPAQGWRAYIIANLTYYLAQPAFIQIMPWLAGLGLFSAVAYRFYKANPPSVEPTARAALDQTPPEPPPPPMPHVNLDPHGSPVTSRLEVGGPGLIQFEVRIRTGNELDQQALACEGPLTGEERRVYE